MVSSGFGDGRGFAKYIRDSLVGMVISMCDWVWKPMFGTLLKAGACAKKIEWYLELSSDEPQALVLRLRVTGCISYHRSL